MHFSFTMWLSHCVTHMQSQKCSIPLLRCSHFFPLILCCPSPFRCALPSQTNLPSSGGAQENVCKLPSRVPKTPHKKDDVCNRFESTIYMYCILYIYVVLRYRFIYTHEVLGLWVQLFVIRNVILCYLWDSVIVFCVCRCNMNNKKGMQKAVLHFVNRYNFVATYNKENGSDVLGRSTKWVPFDILVRNVAPILNFKRLLY